MLENLSKTLRLIDPCAVRSSTAEASAAKRHEQRGIADEIVGGMQSDSVDATSRFVARRFIRGTVGDVGRFQEWSEHRIDDPALARPASNDQL